jgi:hypothetical protein
MGNTDDVSSRARTVKEEIHIVDLGTLGSPNGVPLDRNNGDDHVVMLFSEPCCSHGAKAAPQAAEVKHATPKYHALFALSEHASAVSGCKLRFPDKEEDAQSLLLPVGRAVGQDLALTYGQVIALGGDFYGDPDQPVCTAADPKAQFMSNFKTLGVSGTEAKQILNIANKYEFIPIEDRIKKGQAPSGAFSTIPWTLSGLYLMSDEDTAFDQATGAGISSIISPGRYLKLAKTNFDHFGVDAMTCYRVGHILAQEMAIQAKKNNQPEDLKLAYAINAFADHFLTDLFAAGHMRTPRRQLSEYLYGFDVAAGFCSKLMHDEDNKFGLWVENARGDRWVAFGDARFRDRCSTANRIVMKKAIQQSMDDVWSAYVKGAVVCSDDQGEVFSYFPKIIKEIGDVKTAHNHRDDQRNWAPLFFFDPGNKWMYLRDDMSNVSVRSFDWKYAAVIAATAAKAAGEGIVSNRGPYMPPEEYQRANISFPPDETGSQGQLGWPAQPDSVAGENRVIGVSGPSFEGLQQDQWCIDSTPGFDRTP